MHGDSVPVSHNGKSIFNGIEQGAHFARYNSLGVYEVPQCFELTAHSNGIIMAAAHKSLPIQGVQFHPESVLSTRNDNGMKIVQNIINQHGQNIVK